MESLQFDGLGQVDLDDDLLGEDRESRAVADRGRRNQPAIFCDRRGFDDRKIDRSQLAGAKHLHRLGEVLVDEHDVAIVDGGTQRRISLEGEAARQCAGLGQQLVVVVAQRGARHEGDAQRLGCSPFGEGERDGFRIACAGEAAHANGHAVLDEHGRFLRRHYLAPKRAEANTITIHQSIRAITAICRPDGPTLRLSPGKAP